MRNYVENDVNLPFMQQVYFEDLGKMDYKRAWDYQEKLLHENVEVKSLLRNQESRLIQEQGSSQPVSATAINAGFIANRSQAVPAARQYTQHHLLFVEHPPVYTLGKSGKIENVLITDADRQASGIDFFYSNRGGDITFHGPGQVVGYPILDLEKFYTDIGRYLRNIEEVMILTMADYELRGERSAGETGVWLQPGIKGSERKIGAIGVRCSRWITMHGFALNVNTDLGYFDNIIPCGIQNKQVTSLAREIGKEVPLSEVKQKLKQNFEKVFDVELVG